MFTRLAKVEPPLYALMRIVVGFTFLWHGSQKLFGFPTTMPPGVPAFVIYVGGPIEFFGGLLVMIGLLTRLAAFVTSGQMAFAYWLAHGTKALLPLQNGGELAVVYCVIFLYVAARGAGSPSVDALIARDSQNA